MDEHNVWDDRSGSSVRECVVRVVNGDPTYAQNPVLVGHYVGDPIVHAEEALDRCLDGELSLWHQLDLYPGAIDTSEVILPERSSKQGPCGALVIGLGPVGDLTRGGLTSAIEKVLLRFAQVSASRGKDVTQLKVSSLLVGSGATGLSMEQSVESILSAVKSTNRRLNQLDGSPAIVALDLVELYEDKAQYALQVTKELSDTLVDGLDVQPNLVITAGVQKRLYYADTSGWWRTRIAIRQDELEPGLLNFTYYGERARNAGIKLYVQSRLVHQLLKEAESSVQATQTGLSQSLFELLVPKELKEEVSGRRDLSLSLDEKTAEYPWELLIDRTSSDGMPVSVASGFLRQLEVKDPKPVSHAEEKRALVVGDPPSSLIALPGAETEAKAIADALVGKWEVVRQIRNDEASDKKPGESEISAGSVVEAALTQDHRIIHLAGHGVYDENNPQASGMILGGDPNERTEFLLSPAEIRQMRHAPDMVFINCCHLGKVQSTPSHRLAANLATEFIKAGVRVVVAAGWAVDDAAALAFARTFYSHMLDGKTFSVAVRQARNETYIKHRNTNTWAAYQCYGDPGFRLVMDRDVTQTSRATSQSHLVDRLGNLVSRAQTEKREEAKTEIENDLHTLLDEAKENDWIKDSETCVKFAQVFRELRQFEQAIEWYEKAERAEIGASSYVHREQQANMRSRFGEQRYLESKGNEKTEREARREDDIAIDELKLLVDYAGETGERQALLGSAFKSRSRMEDGKSTASRTRLVKDLRLMTSAYFRAMEFTRLELPYHGTNALFGTLLCGGPWDAGEQISLGIDTKKFLSLMNEIGSDIANLQLKKFWDAVHKHDLDLVFALANGELESEAETLGKNYVDTFNQYGSAREIDSVVKQIDFIDETVNKLKDREKYGMPGNLTSRDNVLAGLKIICNQLVEFDNVRFGSSS